MHDATVVRSDFALTPNEARNAALATVDTEYVVFLDDNAFVRPGWLEALVRCADETGAAIVGPLIGFRTGAGRPETVHVFDGENHIVDDGTSRRFVDHDDIDGIPLDEATATLGRRSSEVTEFHCMLARRSLFDEVGLLDEGLRSAHEHLDLCMLALDRGREIWLEPASVVVYELPIPLPYGDRLHYVLRWSEDWNRASTDRFVEKWRLDRDDPWIPAITGWLTHYRQLAYRLSPKWLDRATKKFPVTLSRVDAVAQRWVLRRDARRRATASGPRVVRAATWGGSPAAVPAAAPGASGPRRAG